MQQYFLGPRFARTHVRDRERQRVFHLDVHEPVDVDQNAPQGADRHRQSYLETLIWVADRFYLRRGAQEKSDVALLEERIGSSEFHLQGRYRGYYSAYSAKAP